MFYHLVRLCLVPLIRLFWLKRVSGVENIPAQGSAIIVANHESYFDFFCLAVICKRRIHFLATERFYKKPLWALLMTATGQIKVPESGISKDLLINSRKVLQSGELLGIFPEGTRSRSGKMGEAHTGAARLALQFNVPIIPVGINGAYEVLSPHDIIPKFQKIIEINVGGPISQPRGQDAKMFSNLMMRRIAALCY
ncbi:MAG: lysophospholipid acyltransferase family protein [Candidatus Margulisbacteria bacterium]|nr:lysophospholipid acyltransferase family protein [Candidatus Margulisiibacteriota bacterium]